MANKAFYNEKQIDEMVSWFKKEKKSVGLIKPADMYRFHLELHKDGRIPKAMALDFWSKEKRLGRERIDIANKVYKYDVADSKGNRIKVPNITDLIHKVEKKEDLIKDLVPLEKLLHKTLKREVDLKNELDDLKSNNKRLRKQVETLEDVLFEFVWYTSERKNNLKDIMSINSSSTKFVKEALESVFNDPMTIYSWFEKKHNDKEKAFKPNDKQVKKTSPLRKRFE